MHFKPLCGLTSTCLRISLLVLVALSLAATPSRAAGIVQVNFKPHFNADVVLNGTPGAFDTEMDSIEGIWSFVTASAGAGAACGGPFLPDDALFAGNATHPEARLGWRNTDNGANAWQTFHTIGSITVEVPNLAYDTLFLYATGAWETFLTVTLNYTSGSPEVFAGIAYPSWFEEAPPGFFNLVDGLDRGQLDVTFQLICEDVNDPGIVGYTLPVDPARTLDSFTLERTDADQGVLNVFGATAMLARQVHDYDLSAVFNADLVANSTACGIPGFDHVHDNLEAGYHMPTAMTAGCWTGIGGNSPGLPDDGVFPRNSQHPRFELAYSNADNGLNARRSPPGQGDDIFLIDVTDAVVQQVHLFGAGGGGFAVLGVKFFYATGSPYTVPGGVIIDGWLADGGELEPTSYYLVDGMDWYQTSGGTGIDISNIDDAALFGKPVATDPSRVLTQIEITAYDPTGFPIPQSTLGLFGAAGVSAPDFYVFVDDFETGDATAWSQQVPAP